MNRKMISLGLLAMLALTASAQGNNNSDEPRVVTPGNIKTNSAPSDAIVLFDGKDLSQWRDDKGNAAGWDVHDGVMTVNKKKGSIYTRQKFASFQLHLEWQVPKDIEGEGQARGNSGVFLQNQYEIQILDSYQNKTYTNGMAGAVYTQHVPLVNAMRKPGEWNVYDIVFTAPIFNADGICVQQPRVTVIMNGILVQNNAIIYGTTYTEHPNVVNQPDGPIQLQAHGDPSKPLSFRNIWIRPL